MPDPYDEILYLRIQQKRKTTAQWAALNPVLLAGEPGIEELPDGSERQKSGDGIRTWNQLPYLFGGQAGASYVHVQFTPSTVWTMAHNLGFKPSIQLLNSGSQEIVGDVLHLSANVATATFNQPISGFARLN